MKMAWRHAVGGMIFLLSACGFVLPSPFVVDPSDTASGQRYESLAQSGAAALIVSVEQEEDRVAAFLRREHRDGVSSWVSLDNVGLSTRQGFLIATRGFGGDMMTADLAEVERAVFSNVPGYVTRHQSYLDGEDQILIRSFVCRVASRGGREVDLGPFVAQTRLMEEECKAPGIAFVNLYWVDLNNGKMRQSRQWISPYLGTLAIRDVPR